MFVNTVIVATLNRSGEERYLSLKKGLSSTNLRDAHKHSSK